VTLVTAVCFSADGRFVAVGSHRTVRIWDLADGRCVHTLGGWPTGSVVSLRGSYTLALSANARFLLTGDETRDGHGIQLWELDGGRCLRSFQGHQGGTTLLRLDADARFALSTGQDRTVRRWALPGDYRGTPLLSRPRRHVELSRLGGRVDTLIAEAERAMATDRFPTALDLLREARAIDGYEREPRVMSAWWALGRRAVRSGLRAAWSSRTWRAGALTAMDLSGDGGLAVTAGRDKTIRLWHTASGTCLRVLEGHRSEVGSVRLSADGRLIVSSSGDGTVRLWDVATGECPRVRTRPDLKGRSTSVWFAEYGRRVVIAGGDRRQVWDLDSGDLIQEPPETDTKARLGDLGRRAHALSTDGRFALSGDQHGDLRLWDAATGGLIRTIDRLPLHSHRSGLGAIHTVRMTADGRFAVAGSYWAPMVVWDIHNGRHVRVLDGHERGVHRFVLTPEGRYLLAAHEAHLRLWELDWEFDAPEAADWDPGATPHLDAFLRHCGPQWTNRDFATLLHRLEDAGYGWLRASGVRAQLDRMTAGPET
jgi:WD40 repeat protein